MNTPEQGDAGAGSGKSFIIKLILAKLAIIAVVSVVVVMNI